MFAVFDTGSAPIDTGNAPIDTGDDPVRGRIAGEYEDHYALGLELTYHWK